MVILDRLDPEAARFDPDFSSLTTGHSDGVVDGLVVLEIGQEDDVEFAQVAVVVILGPTDGWVENAEGMATFSAQAGLLSCCVSHLKCRLGPNLKMV